MSNVLHVEPVRHEALSHLIASYLHLIEIARHSVLSGRGESTRRGRIKPANSLLSIRSDKLSIIQRNCCCSGADESCGGPRGPRSRPSAIIDHLQKIFASCSSISIFIPADLFSLFSVTSSLREFPVKNASELQSYAICHPPSPG